ncbi:putative cobalt-precorrin-6A synthase [deacetylating] [Candidatus Moduliflexus flocculans]|uniref:Cobalt-precorrin-5B C(1)-methyltransferase n=1 Tax=Candidatus Moduliflexus flocculans TaxID=1499966 RepID=A0A0S6VRM5_9BACT|nr:putative cobalt-precorrin-6A synthase [deacetylating] [Candidatus Moduliflexus flocculans]
MLRIDDLHDIKDGQRLRCGYTTGSCAAAAAKAAALMLRDGAIPEFVELETPAGITLNLRVEQPRLEADRASCCIVKDAGDDPDVTNGIGIFAKVKRRSDGEISIDGGEGIGRITRKGFWGEVGDAAINPVPRKMIRDAVRQVAAHGWDVLIFAPHGREIAQKTFNPNLGIEDGISIIGTTGIVRPMSDDALKKTIFLEIDQIAETSAAEILLCLGNYGEKMSVALPRRMPMVKIANFIGESLAYCHSKGFQQVTLFGHVGKLSKLAIGAFNTHNRVCDARIEAFVYYLALAGAPYALLQQVNQCVTSEDAAQLLIDSGHRQLFAEMQRGCVERIQRYVKDDGFIVDVIFYSLRHGILVDNSLTSN